MFNFGAEGQSAHFFLLSSTSTTTLPELLVELVRLGVHQAVKVHSALWTPGGGGARERKEVSGWEFFPSASVVKMTAIESSPDNMLVISLLFADGGEQLATLHATQ